MGVVFITTRSILQLTIFETNLLRQARTRSLRVFILRLRMY
ncbi:hypothetical protein EV13_2396 [Prochlorococcus sp. MIT 0702]|nr:hypothetical protein EV13_2396 [Prochlorococcus sp. MIT 0702]KGG29405.1 hypothetical protein EV12_0187 [Prochlorococcus sp. MIT 0701]